MRALFLTAAALAAATAFGSVGASHGGVTVLKAGTVHPVDGAAITGGAAVVMRDGVIVAVGKDVAIPGGAEVIDYGPDAVIVPGLVSAGSAFSAGVGSTRTADPAVRAIDAFDVYSQLYLADVMGGVTTAYISPSRSRLIGGQGAVVRLAGDEGERVLQDSASIHGTITAAARSVPGYWEPPIPATVDVGLGVAEAQLPGSAMGAVIALDEIIARAKGRTNDDGLYGPLMVASLRELMQKNLPWRMGAESTQEIRALLEWSKREKLPLVIEGGGGAGELATELAQAKVAVVVDVDLVTDSPGRDFGFGDDARRPRYDVATKLAAAGVEFAIATDGGLRPSELRFAAQLASRGGLSAETALRAITLGAAKVLGVDARVGSLTAGKDADICVLSGAPMSSSGVVATWVRGELAWKSPASHAVVIEADELFLGDGEVLRPGQVLITNGRIAEVGRRVGRPQGATVVRAPAAMPGMIDALGFLGLEGSNRVPQTDFKLARVVQTGDKVDRMVAKAGVTTVMMTPRGTSESGAPILAYKPAASDVEKAVVADPSALRVQWSDNNNRLKSGARVKEALDKAVAYDKKWREYEEALKKWVPPPAGQETAAEEKKPDEKAKEGDKKDADKPEEKKDESGDKKDDKSDKKKKDKKDEEEADPVTGQWSAKAKVPPFEDEAELRLRLELRGEKVTGTLRGDQVSSTLVQLAGSWKEKKLLLMGVGTRGWVRIEGEPKGGKFEAALKVGEHEAKFDVQRDSKELPSAKRPEIRREKKDEPVEPKGKPRSPGIDARLEPFRRAMKSEAAIIVNVDREDEILACVAAFEAAGIKPVLFGADEAWRVAETLRGRVSGVLLTQRVIDVEDGKGWNDARNRYAELAAAGIALAFHSSAEDGASELPLIASYAVAKGLSADVALRSLTSDVAKMMGIASRVGRLAVGLDGDVLLLDGPPLEPSTSVLRAFVNGEEIR